MTDEQEQPQDAAPEEPTAAMPKEIAIALVKAQAHARAVEKRARDKHQDRDYASMDQLVTEAREALGESGLGVVQYCWRRTSESILEVSFMVVHESGLTHAFPPLEMPVYPCRGMPPDKAVNSALTYALGYFERGLVNLPRIEKGADGERRNDQGYDPKQDGEGGRGRGRQQQRGQQSKPQEPQQDIDSKTGEVIVRAKPGSKHQGKDLREMSLEDLAEYMETVEGWLGKAQGPKQQAVRTHLEAVTEQWLRKHETADLTKRYEAIQQRAAQSDDPWVKRLLELAEKEYLARLQAEKGESRTDDEGEQVSSDDTSAGEAAE